MNIRGMTSSLIVLAAVAVLPGAVAAQGFPSRPLASIVPSGSGAGSDILCRQFTDAWTKVLGQPFVTENKPGGNNIIATEALMKAPADGYTVLCVGAGSMAPALHKNLPWDFFAVADPVVQIFRIGLFLFVNPNVPAKTAQEFIAHAKANPGKLNFYTLAPSQKIGLAMFQKAAGISMVEIPYKSGQSRADLIAGVVQAGFDGPAGLGGQISAGQIRLLFTASDKRAPLYPDVPTSAEVGLKDLLLLTGLSFWVPKGTPKEAVAKLNATFNEALKTPELRGIIEKAGGVVAGGTPEDLLSRTRAEHAVWNDGARLANYRPE